MNIWQMVTWDVARAGGFTAFGLLTLAVAIGLALSLHIQSPRWPRIINSELHNFVTLLALIFTGVHVLAVWIDPFTHFGWNEVFVPLRATIVLCGWHWVLSRSILELPSVSVPG